MQEAAEVDVLVPTYNRPSALAVTLTGLLFQEYKRFNVVVSDQSDEPVEFCGEVSAVVRALRLRGHSVSFFRNLPRRGMAQQRQFLLDQARSDSILFLDDDLILEPFVLRSLVHALKKEQCGFTGCGTIGLSYLNDERKSEQEIELWDGRVEPEEVRPGSAKWRRHVLHNAANLYHVQNRLRLTPERPVTYKLAWASGCVLYDRRKLLACGGFEFWKSVPETHCGEDVAAQLRVMSMYGGCGVAPCGVYHQELRTTIPSREFNIPERL